jgi:hypothetical protein
MRWAPQNVDPLLALRDLICNKRWSEGWELPLATTSPHRASAKRGRAVEAIRSSHVSHA